MQLQVAREGRQAVCVVRDRGIGIPEADREWLFTAFHRGGNVADRPGSGLGLVIVKRCVDLHGGGLEIFQKLGVETRSAATLRGLEVLACRK